jgi:competence protein ComEA
MQIPVRLVILKLTLLLVLTACRSTALKITAAPLPSFMPALPSPTPGAVVITVDGAVNASGSYTLPPGSRVDDAVRAAGGPASDADLERINLARILNTDDHIYVLPTPTPYGLSVGGKIDINLADAALLQTLPGVGPAIAQRIVEYREMNGPFETIEKIQEVQGVGPVTFENIGSLITIGGEP